MLSQGLHRSLNNRLSHNRYSCRHLQVIFLPYCSSVHRADTTAWFPVCLCFSVTEHPPFRPYFDSTQDLLSRFQLLSAYDKYVRPYSTPVGAPGSSQLPGQAGTPDKGKGKEREVPPRDIASPAAAQTPGAGNDGDDEEGQGKGEKKWKNNYKHLIKGIPGACHSRLSLVLVRATVSTIFCRKTLNKKG